MLLESWKLPEEIYVPIRWHHQPFRCPNEVKALEDRAKLLGFASNVATLGSNSPASVPDLVQWAQRNFALDQATLIKFLTSVMPTIREYASLLKLDIGECPNYAGIIAKGCEELVRLSVEPARTTSQPAKAGISTSGPPMDATTVYTTPHTVNQAGQQKEMPREFDYSWFDAPPAEGAMLNGYKVESLIGRGGMGIVLKAFDPGLGRHVAIKMLRPEGMVRSEGASASRMKLAPWRPSNTRTSSPSTPSARSAACPIW